MVTEKYTKIGGVVLAGGKCTRYGGRNKAFLEVGRETFYDRTLKVMSAIFKEMIVITNTKEHFPDDAIPKYADIFQNIGPLGGIHSALAHFKQVEAIFIVAVDMPFLNPQTIQEMVQAFNTSNSDILIPMLDGKIEPMAAIYSKNILTTLDAYLKSSDNYSIRSFFDRVNTQFYTLEITERNRQFFYNINSPKDFEILIKSLES